MGNGSQAVLEGTVTFESNPLPGASVKISSPDLVGTMTMDTDADGNYRFGAIPPGTYTVHFAMESMVSETRTLAVGTGETGRADVALRLAAVPGESE